MLATSLKAELADILARVRVDRVFKRETPRFKA